MRRENSFVRQVGTLETSVSVDLRKMGSKNLMALNVNYREVTTFGYHLEGQIKQ